MATGFNKAWELALILALVFCLVGVAYGEAGLAKMKLGEMLTQTERADGGDAQRTRLHDVTVTPTLTDLGLTKRESAEAQILASISIAKGWMTWMKDNEGCGKEDFIDAQT
jgi:hypothetical protein